MIAFTVLQCAVHSFDALLHGETSLIQNLFLQNCDMLSPQVSNILTDIGNAAAALNFMYRTDSNLTKLLVA